MLALLGSEWPSEMLEGQQVEQSSSDAPMGIHNHHHHHRFRNSVLRRALLLRMHIYL